MAGFILTNKATLQCLHLAPAKPAGAPSPRVKIDGGLVVTSDVGYAVSGCPMKPPCVSAMWQAGTPSLHIRVNKKPVVLLSSMAAVTPPTNGFLQIVQAQTRIKGR